MGQIIFQTNFFYQIVFFDQNYNFAKKIYIWLKYLLLIFCSNLFLIKIFVDQKKYRQKLILYWTFFWPKIFLTKNYFLPIFLTKIFFWPKFFLTEYFFSTKYFCNQNICGQILTNKNFLKTFFDKFFINQNNSMCFDTIEINLVLILIGLPTKDPGWSLK